jgi:hypothetical protein
MTYYNPVCPKCGSDGVKTVCLPTGITKTCFACKNNWEEPPLELVPMEIPK